MNFITLGRHVAGIVASPNATANGTLTSLPTSLLEAVVPGYGMISHFIYNRFGFDISVAVTALAIVLGAWKALSWLWLRLYYVFDKYCMSRVHVDENDDLFDTALKWLAAHHISDVARSVKARTQYGSAWDEGNDEKKYAVSALDENGHFNYGKWQARVPPRFEPYYGANYFWYKGRYFRCSRSQKPNQKVSYWHDGDDDLLEISCVGWSTRPIKELLQDMKMWSMRDTLSRTRIRHATAKRAGRGIGWSTTTARPSRPMSTVILDDKQKRMIVNDMNEFLHPNSPKWYATRGIPYRRGYLFHGPPGTGKTSLSFALAGIFGLDLYCFALNDPDLTESDLLDLFNSLPRRCIVLLEDIDEAGLKREDHKTDAQKAALTAASTMSSKPAEPETSDTSTNKRRDSKIDDDIQPLSRSSTDASATSTSTTSTDATSDSIADRTPTATKPAQLSDTTPTLAPADQQAQPTAPPTALQSDTDRAIAALATALTAALASAKPTPSPLASARKRRAAGGRGGRRDPNLPPGAGGDGDAGISLSGLLNAIDGVATHEGRVLIMTTNHPETLDEALVRSGRVDLSVGFDYASRAQVGELFGRMYGAHYLDGDEDGEGREGESGEDKGVQDEGSGWGGVAGLELWDDAEEAAEGKRDVKRRLEELAERFAERVSDRVFSPSDVQGYLLLHKKSPLAAVREVDDWREEELKRKRERVEREKESN